MDPELIIAFAFSFSLALIVAICNALFRSKAKLKKGARERGFRREEFQIDPNAVPEFKPTWRNAKVSHDCR